MTRIVNIWAMTVCSRLLLKTIGNGDWSEFLRAGRATDIDFQVEFGNEGNRSDIGFFSVD